MKHGTKRHKDILAKRGIKGGRRARKAKKLAEDPEVRKRAKKAAKENPEAARKAKRAAKRTAAELAETDTDVGKALRKA